MRGRYLVWMSHVLMAAALALGVWWIVNHMHGMPDYKLAAALAAITGFVLNHFRWWALRRRMEDSEITEKMTYFVAVNYVTVLLVFALVDFRP
jgi:hypothetical protein